MAKATKDEQPASAGTTSTAIAVKEVEGVIVAGIEDIDESAAAFDGERVSGGWTGPSWVPHYSQFNNQVITTKMAKLGPGSSACDTVAGTLAVGTAWGRRLYFIDVPVRSSKEPVRVHLPEHISLYSVLNALPIGVRVKLTYVGTGKAKAEQQAPHLYDVIAERGKMLPAPRADALTILRRDDDVEFPPKS